MGLFDFLKKEPKNISKEERYGKASLRAYKTDQWDEAMVEFGRLEYEGLTEASIALGQYAQITDKERALKHFRKAAAAGDAEGAWSCAAIIGHEYVADITGRDEEWYNYCLQAARGGCADAMNELANFHNRIEDYLGAFYWYRMAELYLHPQGSVSVIVNFDKWHKAGKPTLSDSIFGVSPSDTQYAKELFSLFENPRYFDSLLQDYRNEYNPYYSPRSFKGYSGKESELVGLSIGHIFEDRLGINSMAADAYYNAARNNSIMGMKSYADMVMLGFGREKNTHEAFSWYNQAADAGEKTSCFVMGEFMRDKSKYLAAYWYSKAYRRGYTPALDRLMKL